MTIQETINRKYKENLNLTNKERAQRAETALAGYTGGDPDDLAATIVDLVTDLLHLGRESDVDPDYITRVASTHFQAEELEETPDEDEITENTENVLVVGGT